MAEAQRARGSGLKTSTQAQPYRPMKGMYLFTYYFESIFIKAGDHETKKDLGQKQQQDRA